VIPLSLDAATHIRRIDAMDDAKSTYREGEEATKEAWRKADGDDSLADKVGNAGDEIRRDVSGRP
jgi:hypothetical protein